MDVVRAPVGTEGAHTRPPRFNLSAVPSRPDPDPLSLESAAPTGSLSYLTSNNRYFYYCNLNCDPGATTPALDRCKPFTRRIQTVLVFVPAEFSSSPDHFLRVIIFCLFSAPFCGTVPAGLSTRFDTFVILHLLPLLARIKSVSFHILSSFILNTCFCEWRGQVGKGLCRINSSEVVNKPRGGFFNSRIWIFRLTTPRRSFAFFYLKKRPNNPFFPICFKNENVPFALISKPTPRTPTGNVAIQMFTRHLCFRQQ